MRNFQICKRAESHSAAAGEGEQDAGTLARALEHLFHLLLLLFQVVVQEFDVKNILVDKVRVSPRLLHDAAEECRLATEAQLCGLSSVCTTAQSQTQSPTPHWGLSTPSLRFCFSPHLIHTGPWPPMGLSINDVITFTRETADVDE